MHFITARCCWQTNCWPNILRFIEYVKTRLSAEKCYTKLFASGIACIL